MKNDLDMKSDTENEEDGTMSTESADVRPAESTDARPAGAQQPTHHHPQPSQRTQPSHHHGPALAGILGPAFVAAVAYVDPGNVAANITSGARYGYLLVWVLVLANCMSVLIQYQSAKLGIVTGKSLPEILGERLGDAGRFMFFMQAEVIAIATDLAEVIGGAIALKLLFGLPLFVGGCIIGAVSTVLLIFEKGATHRIFEKLIIGLLLVITFGFIAGLFIAPPNPKEVVAGLIPRFKGTDTVLMATSMLGATVMPHAIYLHSTLVNDHYAPGEAKPSVKKLLHGSKIDVAWALLLAGSVNLALLILAANSLYGMTGTDTIEGAQRAIQHVLGPVIGTIFSIGLLASSLSSTSVGIPFAIIPLMRYTHDRTLMGEYVDGPIKHAVNIAVAALIVALNVVLIVLTMLGKA